MKKQKIEFRAADSAPVSKATRKKRGNAIFTIIFIVLLCVMLFSGYKLFTILSQYLTARKQYAEMGSQYVSSQTVDTSASSSDSQSTAEKEKFPIHVDFDSLKNECADITGWLYSPDTIISYPVVQCKDNDYYLHRFMDGSYSPGGTLFVDCNCPTNFEGRNSIIYGHHMNDGSMLASITKYRNQDYFNEHPVMYLATLEGNYKIEIFSAYVTAADSYTYKYTFESSDHFAGYLNQVSVWSEIETGVTPTADDRIITLSTCTYDFDDARYIVHGVLVPMD